MTRFSVFVITVALISGMAGCVYYRPSENLEIQTWYDLDAVRNNLAGNHTLMNDLDSTSPGYEELASPTANEGYGWWPIGVPGVSPADSFLGEFDGQGYEIRDLYTNGGLSAGLFGSVDYGGVIKDVGVMNVTAIGYRTAGSLVGENRGTVSNCYSSGNVDGYHGVGGLVGRNYLGTVSNCYSTGNVTGDEGVGGLVGMNDQGTVSNCYSTGNVTGDEGVGGLVGMNDQGTVSNSFWDVQTCGQTGSDGGTGKTTAEMQDITTFTSAGWNIITVGNHDTRKPSYAWNIVDGESYPFLSWEV